MYKLSIKELFVYFVSSAIFAQSFFPYLFSQQVSAQEATESAILIDMNSTVTSTVTSSNLSEALEATPAAILTVTPTPTNTEIVQAPSPTPTVTLESQGSTGSAELTPVLDSIISLEPQSHYRLSAGQRAVIIGDVLIDGKAQYDSFDNTVAVDSVIDGNEHLIYAQWGASIILFTAEVDLTYINQKYTDEKNSVLESGKTIDRSSLNQFNPIPESSQVISISPGEIFNVSRGQRLIISGDVRIDGVEHFDKSHTTAALNVLVDEETHVINFPYGGEVHLFSETASNQFIQLTYNNLQRPIIETGRTIDIKSLNQLSPQTAYSTTVHLEPGEVYHLQSGRAIIYGDIAIDNIDHHPDLLDFHDDNSETVGLHVLTDGVSHIINALWGATLIIYNTVSNMFLDSEYIDAKNALTNLGQKLDPTSLNQLTQQPVKSFTNSLAPGSEYHVPTGQRVMVIGDVEIDGLSFHDSDSETMAVHVLNDGNNRTIVFPYGGAVRVYTEAATTQHIVSFFVNAVAEATQQGKDLDPHCIIQL